MEYTSLQHYAGKIHRLTVRMMEFAEKNHWQAVTELEAERQATLESLFSHPQIAEHLSQVADVLREVMDMDRRCILLGEQQKHQSGEQLTALQHNKRAMLAYQNILHE